MPRRITGLPRGMVPRLTPPVDMSRYLGSYRDEVRRLEREIADAVAIGAAGLMVELLADGDAIAQRRNER